MAFGYRYWMVYLPEYDAESYLLFVHNPAGSTKLRSYASGRERVVGQPSTEAVFRQTEDGKTRHECEPHKTDDAGFWHHKAHLVDDNGRRTRAYSSTVCTSPVFHKHVGDVRWNQLPAV
ncbi:MAG: hypothetical protein ABI823_03400 [Bryobacteraceae bacterium]